MAVKYVEIRMKKRRPLSAIEKLLLATVVAPMTPGILGVAGYLFFCDLSLPLTPLSRCHGILGVILHAILEIPFRIFWMLLADIFMAATFGLVFLAMFAGLAYPALIVWCPIYFLFRRLKWNSLFAYCLGGPTVGVSYFFALEITNHRPVDIPVFLFAAGGGISAVTFWLIVRPDILTRTESNAIKKSNEI